MERHTHPLAELYPTFSREQLDEAEENLKQYAALAARMFERIWGDPEAHARLTRIIDRERAIGTAQNIDAGDKKFDSSPEISLSKNAKIL